MIKQYKLRDYNFRLVLFLVVLTFMGCFWWEARNRICRKNSSWV